MQLTRLELQSIRDSAAARANLHGSQWWKRAYMDLAYAAQTLDTMEAAIREDVFSQSKEKAQ